MESILDRYLFGIGLGSWLEALACVLGAYLVGKLLSFVVSKVLKRIAVKTRNKVDDIILAVAEKPLIFLVFVGGVGLGLDRLGLEGEAAAMQAKVVGVLVTLAVAWMVDRFAQSLIVEYLAPAIAKSESKLDDQLLPFLGKGVKLLVWALAILVGLKNAGYDVGALLAGLGIGGVAVALAAKDTLSNLFGSVAVFLDRSFAIGDRIKVAGFDGSVKEIGVRSSRLVTLDNRVVTLPNAIFAANPIENVSAEPNTKVAQTIELAPGSGYERVSAAIEALKGAAGATEGLDSGTIASFSSFAPNALRITFVVFIKKGADYFGTLNALNLEALKRLDAAGVALAVPTSLVVERKA